MDTPPESDYVTIVVMTRNRWPDLQKTLPRHRVPVILVDNGSTDGTPALVREHHPEVDVVELETNHGSTARNVGVERARTPYVAFADDDSWWAPGALARAAATFDAHPRLAVLAAHVLVGDDEAADPICGLLAHSPLGRDADLPGPSVLGFLACGAVVRRDAFLAAEGFDEVVFFMGEEERLALDLAAMGWGLAYVEDVVAHHHPSPERDRVARAARAARNELLTAVMRRPWPVVLRAVAATARTGAPGRSALRQALPALPRALARRRRLPRHVEAARRSLGRGSPPATAPSALQPDRRVGSEDAVTRRTRNRLDEDGAARQRDG